MCYFSPGLYYWTLLFPSLSGTAILLIATMVGGYGGLICALLFPWLARSIFTQYHRMTTFQRFEENHIRCEIPVSFNVVATCLERICLSSRSPNPIYLGTLGAGMFHSLLCFYGKIMPNILNGVTLVHLTVRQMARQVYAKVTQWMYIKITKID